MQSTFEKKQAKAAERAAKKEAREQKKEARLEKLRIMKLPAKKVTPQLIKQVLEAIDPDSKFSEKKVKAVTARIKQIASLKPGVIANRLRARKVQVEMIAAIFEAVI